MNGDHPILPLFIFDQDILEDLEDERDARVTFIHRCLSEMNEKLKEHGSSLMIKHGRPIEIFRELLSKYDIMAVHTNGDYEPYAMERDAVVKDLLAENQVEFCTHKDQVIFEKDEVVKDDGTPYTVYTPYMKKWKKTFEKVASPEFADTVFENFLKEQHAFPALEEIGFKPTNIELPEKNIRAELLHEYADKRNIPSADATTRLGTHLRFGTVSIRKLVNYAKKHSDTFLNELIWREFFMQILFHFPHVVNHAFRRKYDGIEWRNNEEEFKLWCEGKTGFPMVDAGMRELNATGFMHNRVRMITASFLVKDLLIDWRWGEAYFANKLLDFDLASNNGNWQWAAGTGCDAAPYFRIFNPTEQMKKFDPELKYIKKWIPEYGSDDYPQAMVDHKMARERTLEAYKKALD